MPHSPFKRQCGFCGWSAIRWYDRINHIADHFIAGKRMAKWKDPWPQKGGGISDPDDDDDDDDSDDDYKDQDTDRKEVDNLAPEHKIRPYTARGGGGMGGGNRHSQNVGA
jgi:hypothetical protein